jgi:hypothetical protein
MISFPPFSEPGRPLMKNLLRGTAFIAAGFVSSLASADLVIPIANHSFEDEVLPVGTFNASIQDWTQSSFERIGTWSPGEDGPFDFSTIDGDQVAYLNGGSIAQQLTTPVVLGQRYHLSALLGAVSSGGHNAGGALELWAGGTVTEGDVIGGTILGSLVVSDDQLVPGIFLPFDTQIVAPTSGLSGSELLAIRFVSNGNESELDNVQLAPIPEPASILAIGVACLFWSLFYSLKSAAHPKSAARSGPCSTSLNSPARGEKHTPTKRAQAD